MELSGALSNPQATLETPLEQVRDLADELRQRLPKPTRQPLRPKPVSVHAAVMAIVEAAGRPMRVRDICAQLDTLNIGDFDKAAVRKSLNERSRGPNPRFRRVGWGLYEHDM
jgi:hypothetical protein